MTYQVPVPILQWQPTTSTGDTSKKDPIYQAFSAGATWETLAEDDGIIDFDTRKGRASITDRFGPGTLRVTLDNTSGLLDPLAPGSPVATAYPGIPMRMVMRWNGVDYPIFSGVLDSGWDPTWARGRQRATRITVADWYGYAAHLELPGNAHLLKTEGLWGGRPDTPLLWWRGVMDTSIMTIDAQGRLWDFGNAAINGRVGSGVYSAQPALRSTNQTCIQGTTGGTIYSPGASGYDPATNRLVVGFVFEILELPPAPSGFFSPIWCQVVPDGHFRWRVHVDSSGQLSALIYTSAGTVLTFATAAADHSDGVHSCVVEIDYGNKAMRITTDLATQLVGWSGTAASPAGRVLMNGPIRMSEVRVGSVQANVVNPNADSVTVVLNRSDPLQFDQFDHPPFRPRPASYPVETGLLNTYTPQQAFLEALGSAVGGAVWCDRAGRIVWRSRDDLGRDPGSGTGHTHYVDGVLDVVARITDAPDPGPKTINGRTYEWPIIRYTADGHSGRDADTIENWMSFGRAAMVDVASWRRYGRRDGSLPGAGSAVASTWPTYEQAEARVAARKDPVLTLSPVTVEPYGDDTATAFVLRDLELEARVLVTQSDQVTAAPIVDDLPVRVQAESWTWADGGATWRVTLTLDTPTPNR